MVDKMLTKINFLLKK